MREKCLRYFLFAGTYFCGKIAKIAKIRTRKNVVPRGRIFILDILLRRSCSLWYLICYKIYKAQSTLIPPVFFTFNHRKSKSNKESFSGIESHGVCQMKRSRTRGTQREYSSKPLKHSIVKRILAFKR